MTATFVRTRPAPQRDKVLAFIRAHVAHRRRFPSMREIADHMGWKTETGARDSCWVLAAEGHLTMERISPAPLRGQRYVWRLAAPITAQPGLAKVAGLTKRRGL